MWLCIILILDCINYTNTCIALQYFTSGVLIHLQAKKLNEETKMANQALQAFKLKDIERQKEQERAIEAYAKKKAEMLAAREKREQEKKAAKEADRRKIADAMERNFLDFKVSGLAVLAKQHAAVDCI